MSPKKGKKRDPLWEYTVAEVENIIKTLRSVTLGLDGSSDGNGNPIQHILAMKGEHHFLLDEVQMYGEKKDAKRMCEELVRFKEYLEEKMDCGVDGMNRDNESKMRKCGDLFLEQQKVADIGCAPHVMHLILKAWHGYSDRVKNAKAKGGKVLTHIKKSKTKHMLKEVAGVPKEKMFGVPIGEDDHRESLKNVAINPTKNEAIKKNANVYEIVLMDVGFWDDIDFTLETTEFIQNSNRLWIPNGNSWSQTFIMVYF
eukprot:436977_1